MAKFTERMAVISAECQRDLDNAIANRDYFARKLVEAEAKVAEQQAVLAEQASLVAQFGPQLDAAVIE